MNITNEILDAIEIIVNHVVEDNTTKIYSGVCKTVAASTCVLTINGKDNTVKYYGGTPLVGSIYQVFVPFGNMSAAFIIVPGGGGGTSETGVSSVNGKTGNVILNANDVGALPSTTVIPTKTSELENDSGFVNSDALSGYAKTTDIPTKTPEIINDSGYITTNDIPVKSVNGKTGAVVLTQDDVSDGQTYVRTHNDFTDVAKQQIDTNKDNIVILDSDIETAQSDITTLKGDVITLTNALGSKQDTITGGASTITGDNLTANRALISDGSGKVAVSAVTSTELSYLDGVTGNVQSQLDNKQGVNDEIQAVRLRGGINSIINNADAVSINPAINAVGFLRHNGGNVQIFYDGYLMPFSNADIDTLFDGKSSTYINFGAGPSHAQTVCLWSETTNYPQNARVLYQTASGVFRWYKALKESQGVIPEGDSTGAWEDVSTTRNTSLMDVKNLEVSIVIDSNLVLKWENGVSFYWRAARQNCGYYKIEVYDSVADQYVFAAERDNISLDEVVNTQYMGVQVNGTGKRFRITFRAQPTQEYGWLAVTQIAFTGISGGIEGTLVNRGGSTMYGNLSPYTAGGASLGTSGKPWKEIQAQNIHGNINDTTSTFSPATSRTNISSGDKLSTIFGKIAKWFSDLGSLAFKSSVAKSDLSGDVQESLNKADTALQSAPVTSVNSKTGAVTLGASDVGAVSTTDVTTTLGTSTIKVPSEKAVSDALSAAGAGDMLKSVYDPNGDVATAGGIKAYADTKLPLTGGTMQGPVSMGGEKISNLPTPTDDGDAVPKSYADTKLPKSGGTMTGNLDMGGQKLQNLPTPEADTDAAPKSYVDNGLKDRSKAVRGTYPAASGQSIAVGDVVDVVNGELVKKVRAGNVEPTLLSDYPTRSCMLSTEIGVSVTMRGVSAGLYTITLFRVTDSIKPVFVIATQEFSGSSYAGQPIGIVALDSSRFVVVARSDQQYFAWVCTVSGTAITAGAVVNLNASGDNDGRDQVKLIRFSNTSVLVVFGLYNVGGLPVQHLSISGTTITPGTIQNLMPSADIGNNHISALDAQLISSRRVFVAADNFGDKLFCAIVNVDAAGTASFGATQLLESVSCTPFCCVNGTDAFVGYINSNVFYGYACTISGNAISTGTKTQLLASTPSYSTAVFTFNGEILIAFSSSVFPIQIDNLTASLGTQMDVAVFDGPPMFGTQLDNERVFLFGGSSDWYATTLKFNNGQIAGRWVTSSKDAIALTAASAGQNCDVLFSGVIEAPGLAVGTNIKSDGVQGYVPQAGVLSAFPWWDYQRVAPTVIGTYVGDDAETQNIELGFQPRAVLVVSSDAMTGYQTGSWPVIHGGLALPGKPVTSGGSTAMELTDTGFAVHKVSGNGYIRINNSGLTRYYIAFR